MIEIFKANDGKHKYYTIYNGKKIYFGALGYMDYIQYYQKYGKEVADKKKKAYIARHKVNEKWNNKNTSGYYARWVLWNKPTIQESLRSI